MWEHEDSPAASRCLGGTKRERCARPFRCRGIEKGAAKWYTSRVTRHTPHVTRHTSHVTRHTSHVTRHTSYVTRHASHVTRHTSHVTRHTCNNIATQPLFMNISLMPALLLSAMRTKAPSEAMVQPRWMLCVRLMMSTMRSMQPERQRHYARHTSHVTRRTSHVTRHTSHVTRHTSHITRQTSHVTCLSCRGCDGHASWCSSGEVR